MKTMAERAAAFLAETRDMRGSATSLAQFAAAEVARVRREQRDAVRQLNEDIESQGRTGQLAQTRRLFGYVQTIDEATRPERPARAKAKPRGNPLTGDPRGDLGTIARKHGMKLTITPAERFDPTLGADAHHERHRGRLRTRGRPASRRPPRRGEVVVTCRFCRSEHRGRRLVDCIGFIQDLVGRARGAYENDRAPDRAKDVQEPLRIAFDALVNLRSRKAP